MYLSTCFYTYIYIISVQIKKKRKLIWWKPWLWMQNAMNERLGLVMKRLNHQRKARHLFAACSIWRYLYDAGMRSEQQSLKGTDGVAIGDIDVADGYFGWESMVRNCACVYLWVIYTNTCAHTCQEAEYFHINGLYVTYTKPCKWCSMNWKMRYR